MATNASMIFLNTRFMGFILKLFDFFDPKQIADRIDEVLDHPTKMAEIRKQARQTVLDNYSLARLLPKHLQLIQDVANGSMARWRSPNLPFCSLS